MTATLRARALGIEVGSRMLAEDVELTLAAGDRVGVVGPNGSGKTTLLRVLAGLSRAAAGEVVRAPTTATVGYLSQLRLADQEPLATVLEVLAVRTGVAAAQKRMEDAATELAMAEESVAAASDCYAQALEEWLHLGGADLPDRAAKVLAEVGLKVDLARSAVTLSGGETARLGLAGILLSRHQVLLLDEPTNDLDASGLEWLRRFIVESPTPLALVSHDRGFLAAVTTGVLEFDPALATVNYFNGGFEAWRQERARAHDQAAAAAVKSREEVAALEARARQVRAAATRGAGNADRKYAAGRVDKLTRNAMRDGASGGAVTAARLERTAASVVKADGPRKQWHLQLRFAEIAGPGPEVVAQVGGGVIRRGGFTLGPLDLTVYRGDRILLAGANGTGKSTLVGALLAQVELDAGRAWVHPGVAVGVVDQSRTTVGAPSAAISESLDLLSLTARETHLPEAEARSLLAKFGLGAQDLGRTWSQLSPGEMTRSALATLTVRPSHLLILDEPTNHLDVAAIDALQEALGLFGGTLILISHDTELISALEFNRVIELGRSSE